jgi:uncharacterized membrane protein YoaT (DUF817 family)
MSLGGYKMVMFQQGSRQYGCEVLMIFMRVVFGQFWMDTNAFQYASQWNFPNEIEEASLRISFKQCIGVA